MNLDQFKDWALAQGSVAKYNDGKFKGECVSLINQFCWRVLNVPAEAWGNAINWITNKAPQNEYFDYVSGQPQRGDILAYGKPYGKAIVNDVLVYFGHIEIYLGGGQSLEQNRVGDGKIHVRPTLNGYETILRIKGGSMYQGRDAKGWHDMWQSDVDRLNKERQDFANDLQAERIRANKLGAALGVGDVVDDAGLQLALTAIDALKAAHSGDELAKALQTIGKALKG